MAELEDDPAAYWNDEAGPRWVRVQCHIDAMLAPITARLLDAARAEAGERVLDVGCGCGTTTLALTEAVGPSGKVLGVDISGPMLAHASERGRHLPHLELLHADAGSHEYDRQWADLVTSRFGVMFFREPERAFANLRLGTKPEGRALFAVWQGPSLNPWLRFTLGAFPELELPLPSPDDGPGPFSLAAPDRVRALLAGAGFANIELEDVRVHLTPAETPEAALASATEVGPLSRLLRETADEARRQAMLDQVRAYLEAQYRDGPPALESATWFVHARG